MKKYETKSRQMEIFFSKTKFQGKIEKKMKKNETKSRKMKIFVENRGRIFVRNRIVF